MRLSIWIWLFLGYGNYGPKLKLGSACCYCLVVNMAIFNWLQNYASKTYCSLQNQKILLDPYELEVSWSLCLEIINGFSLLGLLYLFAWYLFPPCIFFLTLFPNTT